MTTKNDLAGQFTEMLEQDRTVAIPTGFKQLDSILNGGIRPGLYVIGGVSSIGKTSFVLQIADNIVATEHDVLYFNLEQSSKDLFAKSVSRETYKKNKEKGLSASEILYNWKSLTDTQKQMVHEAQDGLYNVLGETIYYYDTPIAINGTQQGIKEIRHVKNSQGCGIRFNGIKWWFQTIDNSQDFENIEVIPDIQVVKDTKDAKDTKDTKGTETSEDTQQSEDVQQSEDTETFEDTEDVENIRDAEGVFEDIHNQTLNYIATAHKAPVVIIDYLQILQPSIGMASSTDKQIADYNILSLKKLSNRYKIPIIAISSFSRTSYDKPVSMEAFKETGAIEYSADVLIGLQPQWVETNEKDKTGKKILKPKKEEKNGVEIRKVEAVILKNRMGKLDDTPLKFDYLPEYNYFQEVKK